MTNFEVRTSGDDIYDILKALLARAHRLFPEAGPIHGSVASINQSVAYRIKHENVLKSGEPWMAIVALTTHWRSDNQSRTVLALDDMLRAVRRYDEIVDQAAALGLFKPRDDE